MVYYVQRRYKSEKPVLYNNIGTKELYGAFVQPESVALIAGERRIIEGSWLAVGNKLLKRALNLNLWQGETSIYLNNPYPFAPGDILRVIGEPLPNPATEYLGVAQGTAVTLGTVTAVDGASNKQVVRITPTAIVKGNILNLWLGWLPITWVATSSDVATIVQGLKNAIASVHGESSILDELEFNATSTALEISHKDIGQIFAVRHHVDQGEGATAGRLVVEMVQGVGRIQFTPDATAPQVIPVGSKIGTIDQAPLGVIAHGYYLTDYDGNGRAADLTAYNEAMINRKALTYLDGAIIQQLPNLSYMPHYQDVA